MLRIKSKAPSSLNLGREDLSKSGSFMSKQEVDLKKATSSTQENALSAQPLLSERDQRLALRETRKTNNLANINSAMPRLATFGDQKA